MVLVDSSVLIFAFRRVGFLEQYARPSSVAICPPVLQELMQGAREEHAPAVREYLDGFVMLESPVALERYDEAAALFRFLRSKGITIRKPMDCLIAAIALHHNVEILHHDRDFKHIAQHTSLEAVNVTP